MYEPGDGRLPRKDGIAGPPVDVGGDAPNGRALGEAREDAPGVGWPSAARIVAQEARADSRAIQITQLRAFWDQSVAVAALKMGGVTTPATLGS